MPNIHNIVVGKKYLYKRPEWLRGTPCTAVADPKDPTGIAIRFREGYFPDGLKNFPADSIFTLVEE